MVPPRDLAFAIIALYLGIDMLSHLDGDRARAESLLDLGVRAAPLAQALLPSQPAEDDDRPDTGLDLVTGAFSYSGAHIAKRLLEDGRRRQDAHLSSRPAIIRCASACRRLAYRFDDPIALARALEGVTTLYNTYWVRFDHGTATFAGRRRQLAALFHAARRAGVTPDRSPEHRQPVNRFAASVLTAARRWSSTPWPRSGCRSRSCGQPGSSAASREILANNIAWILRRMPLFAIPGDGRYPVQPVHIDDLARICVEAADADGDVIVDAAGPRDDVLRRARPHDPARDRQPRPDPARPPTAMAVAARALGLVLGDVVLTAERSRA